MANDSKTADEMLSSALAECTESVKMTAAPVAKRTGQAEAAQDAESRRAADEYFSRSDVRDSAEAAAFRTDLHAEMVARGRSSLQRTRSRQESAAAPNVPSPAARAVGVAMPPRAPTRTAAKNARGSNAMATKARLALSRTATIDLTTTSVSESASGGTERGRATEQCAPLGVRQPLEVDNILDSDSEGDEEVGVRVQPWLALRVREAHEADSAYAGVFWLCAGVCDIYASTCVDVVIDI